MTDPFSIIGIPASICANLATKILEGNSERISNPKARSFLQKAGLLEKNSQEQMKRILTETLESYFEKHHQYKIQLIYDFFQTPTFYSQVGNWLLEGKKPDSEILQKEMQKLLAGKYITKKLLQDQEIQPASIVPNFLDCFDRALKKELTPAQWVLFLETKKEASQLHQHLSLVEEKIEDKIEETRKEFRNVMDSSARKKKKEDLEERLAKKIEVLDALNRHSKLPYQGEEVEESILKLDNELQELEQNENNPRQQLLHFEDRLPEIDYKKAMRLFEKIWKPLEKKSGAALFLLQNSHMMGGKWLVRWMKDCLNKETNDLRHFPIGFSQADLPNEQTFLNKMGEHLNCLSSSQEKKEEVLQSIIKTLCGPLRNGSIIFIEINQGEDFFHNTETFQWFVKNFWHPLIEELPRMEKNRKIRLFTAITLDTPLNKKSIPQELCCTQKDFSEKKILELPLKNWTLDEIRDWLDRFSGRENDEIDRLTEKTYAASNNGVPNMACSFLMKNLTQ